MNQDLSNEDKTSAFPRSELRPTSDLNAAPAQQASVPDINELPRRPILQTLVGRDAWVCVDFYRNEPITKEMIFRTIELLCMMHDGWS